ncbi:MAG: serine/threonine protein kinase [Labilithrix sp.]|nr:serine/threonine protein kinase [Labilithrix sp.]MCW5811084.1 serine/threonine protein kinase [Labilithrix sp.]
MHALQDPFGIAGVVLEGQYRVDRMVGEGGFGAVYRGHHLTLDQPIAIKLLKGLDGGDARVNALVLEKFRAEARLLYTLSQSSLNIVRALDFNATTTPAGVWAPFTVLEWLEGRSLEDDLEERQRQGLGGRSIQEALTILAPVAEGLGVAHKHQVAHRDIKPANVFLVNGGRVKVLDFGIAKIVSEAEAGLTRGTLGSFTWLYAAPEQLDPRVGATGLATDVYGFALLVTEILTGRAPIEANDVVGVMRTAMDTTRRPTPRTRGANVTDELEAICARALAVDPKNRFADIEQLWVALSSAAKTRSATTMQRPITVGQGANPLAATNVAPSGPRPSMPSAAMWTPPPPTPPGFGARGPAPPQQPWPSGPPIGTPPPGAHPAWMRRLPVRPPEGMGAGTITLLIIAVVLTLFISTCAMCGVIAGAAEGG